jgi:hypothetical protein
MKYIYVDYENLNNLKSLQKIDGKYFFFIGETQGRIRAELILSTNNLDVEWIKIKGAGKNALDFYIAYYLAKHDEIKNAEHFILSKDTGFDPLINHLRENGVSAKRIITLDELNSEKSSEKPENYDAVVKNLEKISKARRPKSIKSLNSHIRAMLKNADDSEIEKLVEELFRRGYISSSDNSRLRYME